MRTASVLSPRTSKLTRAQGTLVDDIEIRRAVKFLKGVAAQSFEPQLMQIKNGGVIEQDGELWFTLVGAQGKPKDE